MSSYETLLSVWNKTLSYSNIFDYPLTKDEIYRFAITDRLIAREEFDTWFTKNKILLSSMYAHDEAYWAIRGREELFKIREKRNEISKKKLSAARLLTLPAFLLPWVKLIAVTGTTAAGNAGKHDDVDLYVITLPNRRWLTRLILLGYVSLIGRRHHPQKQNKRVSFCLNHVVDSNTLEDMHHDVYIANEIARMRVLWERSSMFSKLVAANSWVSKFMPIWFEAQEVKRTSEKSLHDSRSNSAVELVYFIVIAPLRTPFILLSWLLDGMEEIAKKVQAKKIQQRIALRNETDLLTVHQHDNRQWILREFGQTV